MKEQKLIIAKNIYSPSLGLIKDGAILIENGKIKSVDKLNNIKKGKNVEEYDFSKLNIFPGFIEGHGHITICGEGTGSICDDSNDYYAPILPHLRIKDSINLDTPELKYARNEGILAVSLFPGSADLIGGIGTIIKTTYDSFIVEEAIIKDEIGLKMAFGENPKRVFASEKKFYTRMGAMGFLREYFTSVLNYKKKKEKKESKKKEKQTSPDIDLKYEIGLKLLNKEFPARAHAHQANDIQNAIKLSEEFGFDLVIEHGTESDLIIDYIKEKNIPIVVGPILNPGLKIETRRRKAQTPARLSQKGILTILSTDAPVYNISLLRTLTGICIKWGMDYWEALKSITINPARICKIDDRYGDIKPGLEPHFVVWEGDPLKDIQAYVIKIFDNEKILDVN